MTEAPCGNECLLAGAKDPNLAREWINDERPLADPDRLGHYAGLSLTDRNLAVRCKFGQEIGTCAKTVIKEVGEE